MLTYKLDFNSCAILDGFCKSSQKFTAIINGVCADSCFCTLTETSKIFLLMLEIIIRKYSSN